MHSLSNGLNQALIGFSDESASPVVLDIEMEINGAVIITGASGAGKTHMLNRILSQYSHKGFPILAIDNHGDIDVPGSARVYISEGVNGQAGVNPLHFNAFEISRFGAEGAVERAVESISRAVGHMGVSQTALLGSTILEVLKDNGFQQNDPTTWAHAVTTLSEVLSRIRLRAGDKKDAYHKVAESLVGRLGAIAGSRVFGSEALLTDDLLVQGGLILDLTGLTGAKRALVAETVLRMCFDRKVSEGQKSYRGFGRRTQLLLVLDEAKILTEKCGNPDDANHIVNILVTEGRKFGLGLIAASQLIRHFGSDTLASAACKIALGPVLDGREKAMISKVLGLSRAGAGFLGGRDSAVMLSSCEAREILLTTKVRYRMVAEEGSSGPPEEAGV